MKELSEAIILEHIKISEEIRLGHNKLNSYLYIQMEILSWQLEMHAV